MRIIIVAGALLGSASALAQTAEPATTPSDASTPAASTAADPSAAASATTAEPAASASATTQTSSAGTVDIAAHDADKDGSLSPLEFAQHLNATSGDASLSAEARRERYSRASGNGAIKLLNSTADEFGAADRNRDRRVDTTELATWHSGGMSASASAATSTPITSGAGSTTPAPETGATMTPSTTTEPPTTEPPTGASTGATTGGSTSITSGAGSASPAPDSGTTMDTPAPNEGTTPTDPPSKDSSDDMQNSTDPNESTTTPPTR